MNTSRGGALCTLGMALLAVGAGVGCDSVPAARPVDGGGAGTGYSGTGGAAGGIGGGGAKGGNSANGGGGEAGGRAGEAGLGGAGGTIDSGGGGGPGGSSGAGGEAGAAGGGGQAPVVSPIVDGPATGTLEVLAGQLGGPGNLDGVGVDARFRGIYSLAVDDVDRRVFVIDGYCCSLPPIRALRAVDLDTARVTTVRQLDASTQVLYQRGYLYIPAPDGILKLSAATGALAATLPLPAFDPVVADPVLPDSGCFVAAPDGDALYYPCGAALVRVDSSTGSSTVIPYLGHRPSGYNPAVAMPSAGTILLADDQNALSMPVQQLLQIDVSSGAVSVLLDYSDGFANTSVSAFDPAGQFFVVDDYQVLPIGTGTVPPFVPHGTLGRDDGGLLYLGAGALLSRWSEPSLMPTDWAGRVSPDSSQAPLPRQGPGASVAFDGTIMNLSVIGDSVFATQADAAGPAVIDLASGSVSLSQLPDAADIAAILPAPGGSFYVASRSSCAVSHVYPDGTPAETLFAGRDSCLHRPGGNPLNPQNVNWATVGLAQLGGRLFMVANDAASLVSIDASQPSSVQTLPLSLTGVHSPSGVDGGITAGADGQLYITAGGFVVRVDPTLGIGVPIAMGRAGLAADQAGHLFASLDDSVLRIDIASGATTRIIGSATTEGVAPGPLPGSLSQPGALAVTSSGDLLIGNGGERVLLRAHFQ